ncbi:MAG: hypothetical protein ACOY46_04100 [Bacillota bacterium]
MNKEEPVAANLESVMYRLMEYDTKEGSDKLDTMIMVSLVNLLGIISVMNKQSPFEPGSRPAAEDPLMPVLMGMLAQGPQGQRGGAPGINPAMLMSLLGSRGQRPENALMLALLSSFMQPPGPPAQQTPGEERERQGGHSRSGSGNSTVNYVKEAGKQERQLSWDMRLG